MILGKLIVIEGLDGSGKSTQAKLLSERLTSRDLKNIRIKLPDYESPSSALVRMYLDGAVGLDPLDVNAYAASLFYSVDRYANYRKKWQKQYESGMYIIADRYTTSNAIHQMSKLGKDQWDPFLDWLSDIEYKKMGIPAPDKVIYLDMPVDVSQQLMTSRYSGNEARKDLHESDVVYLEQCREAAMYAAKKLNWQMIDCCDLHGPRSVGDIANDIFAAAESSVLG